MDMSVSRLRGLVMDREAWRAAACGIRESQTPLSNWTELEAGTESMAGVREWGWGWKSASDMMSWVRWYLLAVIMNETEAQVQYVMEIQECWTRELQSFRNLILILNPVLGVRGVGRKGCTASSHLILLPIPSSHEHHAPLHFILPSFCWG